jgi:hypothetical protein
MRRNFISSARNAIEQIISRKTTCMKKINMKNAVAKRKQSAHAEHDLALMIAANKTI